MLPLKLVTLFAVSLALPLRQATAQQPSTPARNPDGAYTIQTSTRIVVLDVVATDRSGNLVQGLTQGDFHITEAGVPQTILHFELGGSQLPPPNVNIGSTADLDRLAPQAPVNIILLDEFNTRIQDMAFARYSLKTFLKAQPARLTAPTMLLAVSVDKFTVLRDYTQDKQALLTALDHHFAVNPWHDNSITWAADRYATAFLTLRRIAEATQGHPGRKNMIWIGRGFPSLDLSTAPVDAADQIDTLRQQCINSLRDARVTLTTIDPAGVTVDPSEEGGAAALDDPLGGNYQFSALARATGGRTIFGRNDVDVQVGAAAQDGVNFYTLTYRPTNTSDDPAKFRRIVTTVDRPGVKLTARSGYYVSTPPGAAVAGVSGSGGWTSADILLAESSTMAYDGVSMSVTPTPGAPSSYQIRVAARSLTWMDAAADEPRHSDVDLVVSTFDRKGNQLHHAGHSMRFHAPAGAPPDQPVDAPLNLEWKLVPDAAAVRARFVVRDNASGRIGTADVDLTQPPKSPTRP